MIGTLDKVEFTQGGPGNQWTTIDGKKYATWWDIQSKKIETLASGSKVIFEPYRAKLWSDDAHEVDCANVARIYQEAQTKDQTPCLITI